MAKRKRKPFEVLTPDAASELRSKWALRARRQRAQKQRFQSNKANSVKIATAQRVRVMSGGLPETNRRKH